MGWGTGGLVPFAVSCGGSLCPVAAMLPRRRFRSPSAAAAACASARRCCPGAGSVRRQLRRQPVPRRGDRAEDAWPRPLHSPALRQPRPPLRGSLAHARFPGTGRHSLLLTAPFRRRPVGSSRNRALPRRTRMALPPAAAFFLFNKCLMAEGSVEKPQRTPNQIKKKKRRTCRRGGRRHPQRRAQSDGQGEPAGRRRERGVSRSEFARSVKAGGISPGIREDGAGRGLLRGAPTRPLIRPHAEMPLKLPEAWRAEPPRCRVLPCPDGRNPPVPRTALPCRAEPFSAPRCLAPSPKTKKPPAGGFCLTNRRHPPLHSVLRQHLNGQRVEALMIIVTDWLFFRITGDH